MLLRMDFYRLGARLRHQTRRWRNTSPKLHLGCGKRHVSGWLNVDVHRSDFDVDLACGYLPWYDESFATIVSQQVIEHLELNRELLPLLRELRRVCRSDGELWLACPDMEKICGSYHQDRGVGLLRDRITRFPDFDLGGAPHQQVINVLFHQDGEHRNLYDFDLLSWALRISGFSECERKTEDDLLARFPEFTRRGDDFVSLYVRAVPGEYQGRSHAYGQQELPSNNLSSPANDLVRSLDLVR
jgi:predicted SAM-dependent methyltransferase